MNLDSCELGDDVIEVRGIYILLHVIMLVTIFKMKKKNLYAVLCQTNCSD